RPEQRIAPQSRDDFGFSGEDTGLRPTEQLVAAEGDQIDAGLKAFRDQRLLDAEGAQVHHAAAAEILVDGDTTLAAKRHELAQLRPGRKPRHAEVARVNAHE